MEFTVDGETRIIKKRDGVIIRSDQEHGVKLLDEPAKASDAWYPMREKYIHANP
jgi:quercetin dioxygenase-like cupin family protein